MFALRHGFGRSLAVLVLSVCIGVLISGCATARTSGGSDNGAADGSQRSDTNEEKSYVPPPTTMTSPEPPGSTLSYGGETVEAEAGSYCWFTGGRGACVDSAIIVDAGIDAFGDKLLVRSGSSMSFAYKGKKLDSLKIAAHKVGRKGIGDGPFGGGRGGESLKARRSGTRAQVVADLPAGKYVLDVFATMPEGDVSYDFGLVVKAR